MVKHQFKKKNICFFIILSFRINQQFFNNFRKIVLDQSASNDHSKKVSYHQFYKLKSRVDKSEILLGAAFGRISTTD